MDAKEFNECLKQLCIGDEKGLESIYYKYSQLIKQIAYTNSINKSGAEEVLSAFFYFLKSQAPQLQGIIISPDDWVFETVSSIVKSYKNRSK